MKNYHTYESCIQACLKCVALCNHCASSCTKEENIKMMSLCIQLDLECAAICLAAAQFMSLGSEKLSKFVKFVQTPAMLAQKNVLVTTIHIAKNVQLHVEIVQLNVEKWRLNSPLLFPF